MLVMFLLLCLAHLLLQFRIELCDAGMTNGFGYVCKIVYICDSMFMIFFYFEVVVQIRINVFLFFLFQSTVVTVYCLFLLLYSDYKCIAFLSSFIVFFFSCVSF